MAILPKVFKYWALKTELLKITKGCYCGQTYFPQASLLKTLQLFWLNSLKSSEGINPAKWLTFSYVLISRQQGLTMERIRE